MDTVIALILAAMFVAAAVLAVLEGDASSAAWLSVGALALAWAARKTYLANELRKIG